MTLDAKNIKKEVIHPNYCKLLTMPYAKPPPLGNRSPSPDFQEAAGPKHEAWDQPVEDGDGDDAANVGAGGGNHGHC